MAVGHWEPAGSSALNASTIEAWLEIAGAADLEHLEASVPPDKLQQGSGLMKRELADWAAAEALDDEQLEVLIRFFTLAEMQLPGWDAGKTSPVIALVKILKSRGSFAPELKRWIRQSSDNRYLPNGAVLG